MTRHLFLQSGAPIRAQSVRVDCDIAARIGKSGIERRMTAGMVRHRRTGEAAAWRNETIDPPSGALMPTDIEGGEFREEFQMAIRQMIVDPPRHRPPVGPTPA